MIFNSVIETKRETETDKGNGSYSYTYTTNLTNVKASAQPVSLKMRLMAQRPANSRAYNSYVPYDTDILPVDHIVYDGEELEISDFLDH